ncbi:omega-amidase, chloroplastic [Nicotiana tabacum]|uniref:Omega-amidase, chloroplastic n=2 Tax=Nicotiana TaxID=4085 RepID=A0A1S4CC82_TOBAC|nr:PREDICTED: omega-amidase,chloroplastic isoform X1 [Nicotiana sylvestris]XP_016498745.1 PREDICTED: omega-amidase, chloroplastic-like [Nicotiana tabacum]
MRIGFVFLSSTLSSSSSQIGSSISRSIVRPTPSLLLHRPFHIIPNRTTTRSNNLQFSARTTLTTSVSSMASSFMPEQARVPTALQLPSPSITKFKIGLCQLAVTSDKERNIIHARTAIEEAAEKGAKLVVLPEIWNSPYSNDSFPIYAEDIDAGSDASPSTAMLSEVARLLKITIVGGSIPERSGDKLYNTCCIFDADGKLKAKHRKIHLFDIDIPGKITFKESKMLTAGETPTVVDTEIGRIGIGICYDIRFQELAMLYAARGAHLICYPGAFNMTTGPLHWELLQRARAVDNQLYVATCSPARDAGAGYVAWGHSTLVGPFGEVLATTEHDEAIIISEIDYSQIEQRRTNLPLEKQRRGDLYQLVDVQRSSSQ